MISPRQKRVFFQLCCRVATVIFTTLVSDQTARPVWQLLNPCRSVRHRGNSTKENAKKATETRQYSPGTEERWKPKDTFFQVEFALSLLLL